MKGKLLLLFLINLTVALTIRAQDKNSAALEKMLIETGSQNPQEKVHLHLDKPYYAVGDDIWFKAYIVDTKTETLSNISKVLYVELIAPNDSVAKQLKLPITSGLTWGDLKLADSLKEGNYRLRAYTQWMRNIGPEIFFDKAIAIGNSWSNNIFTNTNIQLKSANNQQLLSSTIIFSNKQNIPYVGSKVKYEVWLNKTVIARGKKDTDSDGKITIEIPARYEDLLTGSIVADVTTSNNQTFRKEIPLIKPSKEIDVQLLPEGGLFIENLLNKIGIKITNPLGKGELAKGTVTDKQGNQILFFETNTLGIGSFYITPAPNETYTANFTFANGVEKSLILPIAQKTGTVLSVNNIDTVNLQAKIYLSNDLLNTGNYHLIAQRNGNIFFSTIIKSDKQVIPIMVPKKELPAGIVQLTLFSEDLSPLNERIVFIKPSADQMELSISNISDSYSKKEKTDFSLQSNSVGAPIQGSFSVSVTKTSAVIPDPENETNILTSLLLTSQLKGYVQKPNYYFLDSWQNRQLELDNLLLTQGWRKIDWKKQPSKNHHEKHEAEKGLEFSGTAYRSGNPLRNGKITIMSVDSNFVTGNTLTDSSGKFKFEGFYFTDNLKFVVQARTEKDKKAVEIMMDSIAIQPVTANRNIADTETNINQLLASYLEQSDKLFDEQLKEGIRKKPILLKQVEIIGDKKSEITFSSNLNGAGKADATFTRKDLQNVNTNLADFLIGRAGVVIMGKHAYIHGGLGQTSLSSPASGAMSIMIDGIFVQTTLGDLMPQDFESMEILKSPSLLTIYGSRGSNGIIALTTRRGGTVATKSPGVINYTLQGYSPIRTFYTPKYDSKSDEKPDLRTTVFWEPNLITDKDGKGKRSYFNTNVPGVYRMVVEGIDINGSLARKVLTYEVK